MIFNTVVYSVLVVQMSRFVCQCKLLYTIYIYLVRSKKGICFGRQKTNYFFHSLNESVWTIGVIVFILIYAYNTVRSQAENRLYLITVPYSTYSEVPNNSIEGNNGTEQKNLSKLIIIQSKIMIQSGKILKIQLQFRLKPLESHLPNFKCCWLPPSVCLLILFLTFVFQLLCCFSAGVLFNASVSCRAFLNYILSLLSFNDGRFLKLLLIYMTVGLPYVFF